MPFSKEPDKVSTFPLPFSDEKNESHMSISCFIHNARGYLKKNFDMKEFMDDYCKLFNVRWGEVWP